jgi:hypothetical protein
MSEIEAMKEKLKYYDTVFKDMEEKIVYYTNEAKTLRNIIIKKCPKCKNLEL